MDELLHWVTATVLDEARLRALSPASTLFLLRRYVTTGAPEIGAAAEAGLTHGLAAVASEREPRARLSWFRVFAEASALSDDERLIALIGSGVGPAVDDLEGLIQRTYEPGEGLTSLGLDEHLTCAAWLLSAFDLTDRLPYSMLADELVRIVARRWRDAATGAVGSIGATCRFAQISCRLARLHQDGDYVARAPVAPEARCRDDAARTLAWLEPIIRDHAAAAGEYGVALFEWFSLDRLPN